jgi:hypothetical protein
MSEPKAAPLNPAQQFALLAVLAETAKPKIEGYFKNALESALHRLDLEPGQVALIQNLKGDLGKGRPLAAALRDSGLFEPTVAFILGSATAHENDHAFRIALDFLRTFRAG